ncbi:MAG: bifunctional methylenetetrahydrofolate dehydrogenase/methenyltetrahydrofolate cyclohydrolase FolD [Opitutales bacterium]|nr:bifunctional methylenetetrahydrofolate dehydrogenase/methenyltetrahydrofolate cyclohydrolase FolD [Opitutales bacterium]MCH8540783.1 bifunctional methylenetetrahydrofolate dehydrogenase/methenyltetrahydrofolate cyclohydrolase FolD [Opitutales bacterium]
MELIHGNAIAEQIITELTKEVSSLSGPRPCVAFIRVGEDPASVSYVRKKEKTAAKIGIESRLLVFPEAIGQKELFQEIDRLNEDPSVNGILIQAPLPSQIVEKEAFRRVRPEKDVDGFHTWNLGLLCQEEKEGFVACTPAGVIELLKRTGIVLRGKRLVVVGRSLIVGKPLALLGMAKGEFGDATVTVCHSRTPDLAGTVRQADIIVAAIGRAHFITADMVKEGAVVIDVGINRIPDDSRKSGYRLVGDVDFENVSPRSSYITPVPGGVGPMTVAMLMKNTLKAYRRQISDV